MTQEELDAESMTGDDAHTEPVETRTTPGADAHIGNDAHSDDDAHKDNPPSRTATFSTRITEEEMERLDAVRNEGESKADFLCRLFDENATFRGSIDDLVSSNEHLQKVNTEIRETLEEEQQRHQAKFDDQVYEIGQLQARITTLENATGAAVVPAGDQSAMATVGIKDVIEEARDMCGDDETCNSIIGKMIDMKAHFVSKAVDHEHDADQNQLDREQKELDRKSKEEQAEKDRKFRAEQAEKEQKNKIELTLAKKGGFRKEFLDDVVFLGGGSPKRPGKEIERRKQQARHAAEDEEEYFDPEAEEELMLPEDQDDES